jgi:hypothetical protein
VTNACGACGALPAEICDGQDNDCDGQIDEGVSNACGRCGLVPAEQCNGIDDDCDGTIDDGVTNACGACGALPAEICDGQDNDCDGQIDEGVRNACGACGAVPAEVCDGQDNDCDGQIDEGVRNACGACGVVPAEVCNNVDDNCNGQIDEGVRNACGACGAVPAEACNNIDDNCDGQIDEGVRNACGACGAVPAEVCNNIDDNCNGQIDDAATCAAGWSCRFGQCTQDICNDGSTRACQGGINTGECNAGTQTCANNAWGVCVGQVNQAPEVCNGRDDDCDGTNDDGAACPAGQACSAGACRAVPEVCNGLDDDSDGVTDDLPDNSSGCYTLVERYVDCNLHSWHAGWVQPTAELEAATAFCPPNPASPAAGCGACPLVQNFCAPRAASYNSCWRSAGGRPYRIRTYTQAQNAIGVTRLLRHCFNAGSGQNSYIVDAACGSLGAAWADGIPATLGYLGVNQPVGSWGTEVWVQARVCSVQRGAFLDYYMSSNCGADAEVRRLGWALQMP